MEVYKGLGEQDLARFCCKGDSLAKEELYRRYAAKVYTLCRRYLPAQDDAKDLMQDTWIQVFEKIQSFSYNGEGSLYKWICRIAINKAINHIKRFRWRIILWNDWERDDISEPSEEEIEIIPEEKLLEWISQLPDLRRVVFNLYVLEGLSHKEIGELLRIGEKSSSGILAKARKQLKKKIREFLKEELS